MQMVWKFLGVVTSLPWNLAIQVSEYSISNNNSITRYKAYLTKNVQEEILKELSPRESAISRQGMPCCQIHGGSAWNFTEGLGKQTQM